MNLTKTPTKRVLPRRPGKASAVVVHTTGDTDLAKILRFYLSSDGYQPHYLIDKTGLIHQFVEEDHVAYHAKIGVNEAALYAQGWLAWSRQVKTGSDRFRDAGAVYSGYLSWRKRWPSLRSPLDLVTGRHPNYTSIGIELQQPFDKELTPDIFLNPQYSALLELLTDISNRTKIPIDKTHVLGHYDCSPMNRSTSRGGWDPGEKFNWTRILSPAPEILVCGPAPVVEIVAEEAETDEALPPNS